MFILVAVLTLAQAPAPPSALVDYVRRAEPDYAWKLVETTQPEGNTVHLLKLTSQKWQGEVWEHDLQIFVPKGVTPTATMVLYNTGGTVGPSGAAIGLELAKRVKAPVAFLYGIPKQPVFGGKKEDALIAETFVKYLETDDATWPLLFPMAKSLIKAMDAVQAFGKQEWKFDVTGFVLTGASKRGWTCWLAAATGDPRIKAIAPMVIDTLNFPKQMPHQIASYGKYSEMIHDYQERNLLPMPDTAAARRLWAMVDPWNYRGQLKLPKLIVLGTNDPYWTQDALNQYWDDLSGEKYIVYVPNAGHDLRSMAEPKDPKGRKDTFPMQAITTIAAFCRHIISGKPMPKLTWKYENGATSTSLTVKHEPQSIAIKQWVAVSETPDFRKSKWDTLHMGPTTAAESVFKLFVHPPTQGFIASFAEMEFNDDGIPYTLSTQLRIVEAKK